MQRGFDELQKKSILQKRQTQKKTLVVISTSTESEVVMLLSTYKEQIITLEAVNQKWINVYHRSSFFFWRSKAFFCNNWLGASLVLARWAIVNKENLFISLFFLFLFFQKNLISYEAISKWKFLRSFPWWASSMLSLIHSGLPINKMSRAVLAFEESD